MKKKFKNIFPYFFILLLVSACGDMERITFPTDTGIDDDVIDTPVDDTPDVPGPVDDSDDDEPDAVDPDPVDPDPVIPNIVPRIASFDVDSNCVIPGDKVILSWTTTDAAQVLLDGKLVDEQGEKEISVSNNRTYKLQVKNGENEDERDISIAVKDSYVTHEATPYNFTKGVIDSVTATGSGSLLIFSEGKVYKGSYDGDFTAITPNNNVEFVAGDIHPKNSKIIYAGTTGRLYRSADGGKTWPQLIPIRRNGYDLVITSVHVSRSNPNEVVVGVDGGAFVYDDAQEKLDLIVPLNTEIVDQVDSAEDKLVYRTADDLFESDASFGNVKSIGSSLWSEVYKVKFDDEGNILVGSDKGLFKRDVSQKWVREGDYKSAVYDFATGYPVSSLSSGNIKGNLVYSLSLATINTGVNFSLFNRASANKSFHYYLANGKDLLEYSSSASVSVAKLKVNQLLDLDTLVGVGEKSFHAIHQKREYENTCD